MGVVLEFKARPHPAPRLRELRVESGLPQRFVAELLGVDRLTVRRYESGRTLIPADHAELLAELFAVSMPWLVGGAAAEPGGPPRSRVKLKAVADGIAIEVPDGLGGLRAIYVARKPQNCILQGGQSDKDQE
jgi:transcriptional regulator with XRE-family HTH domain